MRTINVSISEVEYDKFGLKGDKISFSEFIDMVSNELSKQTLSDCVELGEKYGLSNLSIDEITGEVKAVRNVKSNT